MKKVFLFIKERLSQDIPVMLMIVIQQYGSSPGKMGFKMAVAADGSIIGSVGGGVMEHKLVERAKKQLKTIAELKPYLLFLDHNPEATEHKSGMICSGNQSVAFSPLQRENLQIIENILIALETSLKGVLQISQQGLGFLEGGQLEQVRQYRVISSVEWEYMEQIGMPDTLYVFGGGHVGLAISKLFRNLGFHVKIFDNRNNLNTLAENRFAHEKEEVDYLEVGSLVPDGFNVYVAIVTFAHKSDLQVLKQMLGKKIKYLGMMGSEIKVKTIFEQLQAEGVSREQLKKVYAPIGISINSESPDEIAVSIAAQIISVKNGI